MTKHQQATLFDDTPDTSLSLVSALSRHPPTDKSQAAFQRLLRQVDEQRSLLRDWNAYGARYHQRVNSELLPVLAEFRAARRRIALLLDTYKARWTSSPSCCTNTVPRMWMVTC